MLVLWIPMTVDCTGMIGVGVMRMRVGVIGVDMLRPPVLFTVMTRRAVVLVCIAIVIVLRFGVNIRWVSVLFMCMAMSILVGTSLLLCLSVVMCLLLCLSVVMCMLMAFPGAMSVCMRMLMSMPFILLFCVPFCDPGVPYRVISRCFEDVESPRESEI